MQSTQIDLNEVYFILNNIWYYGNLAMMPLFMISMINRFRNPEMSKNLWTDHLARVCLAFTTVFYVFDIYVKYHIDGGDTICQKSFLVHHISSLFLIPPLYLNRYIPWFVNPVGFFHGIAIFYPEIEMINYVYALFLFVFQYGIYQKPYRDLKGYWLPRYCMNFIWVFALLLLIGDCSNYLPLQGIFI